MALPFLQHSRLANGAVDVHTGLLSALSATAASIVLSLLSCWQGLGICVPRSVFSGTHLNLDAPKICARHSYGESSPAHVVPL